MRRNAYTLAVLFAVSLAAARPVAAVTTFSGRAFGAQAHLTSPTSTLIFADTGNLPSAGGSLNAMLTGIMVAPTLTSGTLTCATSGSGSTASSSAALESLSAFGGTLSATHVEAHSSVTCTSATGSVLVSGLVFAGASVTVTGQPNQKISVAGVGTLVIDEQVIPVGEPDITVNALHLTLATGDDLIVASAHSDIDCTTPARSTSWGTVKEHYR